MLHASPYLSDFFKQLGEDNEATDVNVFVEQHVSLSPENPLSTYTPYVSLIIMLTLCDVYWSLFY